MSTYRIIVPGALVVMLSVVLGGCKNAGEGAISGGGIGALTGLAIGSITGHAGEGAAIGAIAGAVGGAVIGDQNKQRAEAQAAAYPPATVVYVSPPPPPRPVYVVQPAQTVVVQNSYSTGAPLGRLVGRWNVTGTINTGYGQTMPVSGTATGVIENTYFVRVNMWFADPRTAQPVSGSSVISQTGGAGLEMTNSFSSTPEVRRFAGEMTQGGTMLNFVQTSPPGGPPRQVIIRMSQGLGWTAEVWVAGQREEAFAFNWVGP